MEPTYSTEAEIFRQKVQAFLGEHLPENWKGIGALSAEKLIPLQTMNGGLYWQNIGSWHHHGLKNMGVAD